MFSAQYKINIGIGRLKRAIEYPQILKERTFLADIAESVSYLAGLTYKNAVCDACALTRENAKKLLLMNARIVTLLVSQSLFKAIQPYSELKSERKILLSKRGLLAFIDPRNDIFCEKNIKKEALEILEAAPYTEFFYFSDGKRETSC